MNLYELTSDYLYLQRLLEDPEEDDEVIRSVMDKLGGELEAKADGYAKVIKNMEGTLAAIKAEQERLAYRKNTVELGISRLKRNLQESMTLTGKTKFKTDLFSFAIQKNGGAEPVILDVDPEELPDELIDIKVVPNKAAIAQYIKETGDITYAHFGERGESLRIR